MSYCVVLKDADPATEEGRTTLRRNMVEALGLEHERVDQIVASMPITLRENVTLGQAQEFASVLRELGALVFVEEEVEVVEESEPEVVEKIASVDEPAVVQSAPKTKGSWVRQPSVMIVLGLLAGCVLMILVNSLQSSSSGSINLSSSALKRMLKSQEKILQKDKKEVVAEVLQESWYGEIDDNDINIKLAILTGNGKPLRAVFEISSEYPGERSAEEIIRGKYRPWLRSGEGELGLYVEPADVFGPKLTLEKSETMLVGAARIYMESGGLGTRVVADANLEMASVKSPDNRDFDIAIRYLPKEKFINTGYFLDFKKTSGYSLVINKKISVTRRKDNEAFFKDPYKKISSAGAAK